MAMVCAYPPVPCIFLLCQDRCPWQPALESLPPFFSFFFPSPSFEVVSCCRDFTRSVPAALVSPKQIQPFNVGVRACIRLSFARIPTHLRTYVRNDCYIVFLNHPGVGWLGRYLEEMYLHMHRKNWTGAMPRGIDNSMLTPTFPAPGLVTGNMCRTELIIACHQTPTHSWVCNLLLAH